MSENINLGTFSWDLSEIEKQLIENKRHLEGYNTALQFNKKQLTDYRKQLQDTAKILTMGASAQEALKEAQEAGEISAEDYADAMSKIQQEMEEAVRSTEGIADAQANLIRQNIQLEQSIRNVNNENRSLISLMDAGRTEIQNNETAYKDLNKELNALKLEAKNLGAQMVIMERSGQGAGEEYEALKSRWEQVSAEANKLNEDFKRLDKAVGDNQRSVGDYKDQIISASAEIGLGFKAMASGDIQGGFESVKAGLSGVADNAKKLYATLMANPVTAGLVIGGAILTGLYQAGSVIWDYNKNVSEAIQLTEKLTGQQGKVADEIRIRAQALSDTFNDDFKEVLQTANVLSKQMGISFDEAFNKIESGYIRGANASGDFLDRLREYAPLLQKYGFDIEEIIGLQITAQQQGFFNDKFEDSLKEAGLSLQEFTKTQADAMSNAFGAGFGEKIFNGINSGALSVKDALLIMGAEAKKQGLSVQQTAQLTADIFKGAGEDASGALPILESMYQGIHKLDEPLTKTQELTQQLSEENLKLATAKDKALKSDTIIEFQKNMEIFGVKASTAFYNFIGGAVDLIKNIDEMTGASEHLGKLWDSVVEYGETLWDVISEVVAVFEDLTESMGLTSSESKGVTTQFFATINPLKLLKGALDLVTGAMKIASGTIRMLRTDSTALVSAIKTTFTQIANAVKNFDITAPLKSLQAFKDINIVATFTKAKKEAKALEETTRKVEETTKITKDLPAGKGGGTNPYDADRDKKAKAVRNKEMRDADQAKKDTEKRIAEQAKSEYEASKVRAENALNFAKSELAEYISINAQKYKDDKRITASKLADQIAYFEEVKKKQAEINNLEKQAKENAVQYKIDEINAKIEAGKTLTMEEISERQALQDQLSAIAQEYQTKEILLERDTQTKKMEEVKKHQDAVREQEMLHRAIMHQQRLLQIEEEGANEFALRQERIMAEREQEILDYIAKNEILSQLDMEKYDADQQLQVARKELETQIQAEDDEAEKLRLQNQLDSLNLIEAQSAQQSKELAKDVDDFKVQSRSQVLGALANLFGEESGLGKAFAIAQITNDTITNASKAFTQASVFASNPLTAPLAPNAYMQGAIIVATGGAQIAKLVTPKKKQLYTGGYTGHGGKYEVADDVEIHRGEMVWSQEDIKAVGGASVADALRPTNGGFLAGGVAGSLLSNVQNSAKIENNSIHLSEDALQGLAEAIYSGAQHGLTDMSENASIRAGADF